MEFYFVILFVIIIGVLLVISLFSKNKYVSAVEFENEKPLSADGVIFCWFYNAYADFVLAIVVKVAVIELIDRVSQFPR